MTNRVQTARSSTSGNRPAAGSRQPGELYVNFPDNQLGVINASQAPQDLIMVRAFSTTATYAVGDHVVQGGIIYRCSTAVTTPGTFNAANWSGYVNKAGDTMTGALNINVTSAVNSLVIAPTATVGANIVLNKAAGQNNNIWAQQAGSNRWGLQLGNGTTEAAGNAGSDVALITYDNTGAALGVPLFIERKTGYPSFNGNGATSIAASSAAFGTVSIRLNKAGSGNLSQVASYSNGVIRWNMILGDQTAEGGGNAGSDFSLSSFSDAGGNLGVPLAINRASGGVSFNGSGATLYSGAWSVGSTTILLNKAGSGFGSNIGGYSQGLARWLISFGNGTAESGTATGSDFTLTAFNNSGASLFSPISIVRSTGVCTFSAAIVNGPSDRTLKQNVLPLEGSLDKVKALQGVSFNMIATPDKREIGLIAQDVEPIVPEIIQDFQTHDAEGKAAEVKLALDYPKLTALLIEAVKMLAARIEALEAKAA